MNKKTVKDINVSGKKVLVRCDFNVPLNKETGEIEVLDLDYENIQLVQNEDGTIELVEISTKGGMKIYRRTLIYIMAMAFERVYPEAKVRVNYQLSDSMYCDLDNMEETDEMIKKVEQEMRKIVDLNLPITKKVLTRKEAKELYEKEDSSKGRLQLDLEENDK